MPEKHLGASLVLTTGTFALTFIVIGLPLWWKTTEVYRYPIPHDECQELASRKMRHVVPVKLVLADRQVSQGVLWEELLSSSFNEKEPREEHAAEPFVSIHWTMRTVTEEQERLIQLNNDILKLDVALDKMDVSENRIDKQMKSYGELEILVLHRNFSEGPKFALGLGRRGYILSDTDSKKLVKDVMSFARKMAQVELLQKLYKPPSSYSVDNKPDKDRMRSLQSSTAFDITFSLIVPEPHILEVLWDVRNAVQHYVNPVLESLSLISKVSVKSQVLYMTSLPITTGSVSKQEEFVVHAEHLPSIINPIEARIGSDTSVHPNLNFVVYIPTQKQTPLRIFDSAGSAVSTNAFLLPQWGGFLIHNCPIVAPNTSLPHKVTLDMRPILEVFLSQLRLLSGLSELTSIEDEQCTILPSSQIRKWELDFLLRKNAQEQLSTAIASLASLSQLLKTIGNIVIRDDVGQKIYFALSSIKESLHLLEGGFLEEGFLKAKSAFVASEEAFFDPSLLALLYFPDDQKYAIYIPLFLPISIPVVTSVFHLWKFWYDARNPKLKPD